MKPSPTVAVASLVCIVGLLGACKSSTRPPASSTAEGGASHVTMEDGKAKHEVSGPAFARVDASQKLLVVYTFQRDTDPAPSCEILSDPSRMKRGGFISFSVKDFDGAPGSYSVVGAGVMLGDADKGDITMLGAEVTETSVAVRSYGDGAFSAEVTSTAAERKLTGSVSGKICPSAQAPSGEQAQGEPPALPDIPEEKPPPVVPKLDKDGVAGMTLGMSPKKLPKGTKKKPPAPKQPPTLAFYDAKGVRFMGQRIKEANIVFDRGALSTLKASVENCSDVIAKLTQRYGEGGTNLSGGRLWRGKKSELIVTPFDKDCVVELAKIPSGNPETPSEI